MRLEKRVALITGAGWGIRQATALFVAAQRAGAAAVRCNREATVLVRGLRLDGAVSTP